MRDGMKQQGPRLPDGEVRDIRELGRDILGPVVADYLSRLHAWIMGFEQTRGARTLFVTRAGVRIRKALDTWSAALGLPAPAAADHFWISRLMVAKGIWRRAPESATALLTREFHHATLADVFNAMLRMAPERARAGFLDEAMQAAGDTLPDFLQSDHPAAAVLRSHFNEQADFFEEAVAAALKGAPVALLVDTGWQGTAQTLLAEAFPDVEWWGAYFGKFGFADTDRREWDRMIGVVFEADAFDPAHPQTATVLNRHLIEQLFEPRGRSIEILSRGPDGRVIAPDAETLLQDDPRDGSDPLFAGVLEHLETLVPGTGPAQLQARAAIAWKRLARLNAMPTRSEARLLAGIARSADFGRDLKVPLLLEPEDRTDDDTAGRRIAQSLWPCGQIAIEYEADMAPTAQAKLSGYRAEASRPAVQVAPATHPTVAVITRTMDRPMFLRRALQSVAAQTFTDYIHVIVNDGGDNDLIRRTIEGANCDHARTRLVDAVCNRGMEAASNLAIRNCDTEFIIIHDDDDTWEPTFLEKAVAFLRSEKGRRYGGVITRSTYISEEVTPAGIVIRDRKPYNGWIENIHLLEMAVSNFFPPIAFLFRREICERLNGFNESYPVLGDWDFNLRFLVEADIGVVREPLANYHHRDVGDTTTFGNSVIAGKDKHLEYSSIVRNNFLRHLDRKGHAATATLVGMGLYLQEQRHRIRQIDGSVAGMSQRVMSRASEQELAATRQGDLYWLALTRLATAVVQGDTNVLQALAGDPARPDPGFARALLDFVDETRRAAVKGEVVFDVIPPDFDEIAYRQQNPDIEAEIRNGQIRSGYEHYMRYGRHEGRVRPIPVL